MFWLLLAWLLSISPAQTSGALDVSTLTDRDGRLFLFDRNKHKESVSGAKNALLPAWSTDGSRLAWVQRSGRRKHTLVVADVSRG
jgi:hypothetical protein